MSSEKYLMVLVKDGNELSEPALYVHGRYIWRHIQKQPLTCYVPKVINYYYQHTTGACG